MLRRRIWNVNFVRKDDQPPEVRRELSSRPQQLVVRDNYTVAGMSQPFERCTDLSNRFALRMQMICWPLLQLYANDPDSVSLPCC